MPPEEAVPFQEGCKVGAAQAVAQGETGEKLLPVPDMRRVSHHEPSTGGRRERDMKGQRWALLVAYALFIFLLTCSITMAEDDVIVDGFDEPVQCEDPITNVLVTVVMFDTLKEMQDFAKKEYGIDPDIAGFSDCELVPTHNMAHCDVFFVRPRIVDGYNMWVLGHEVFHGICGPEYHE